MSVNSDEDRDKIYDIYFLQMNTININAGYNRLV